MDQRTRILIVTDCPVLPSGMGETRASFSPHSSTDIHRATKCTSLACFIAMRLPLPDGPLRFSPDDRYRQKTFFKIAARIQPDVVFAFGEPQRVSYLCAPRNARRHRLILYVNFDGLSLPPGYGSVLRHADLLLTKSEFAKKVLASAHPDFPADKLSYLYAPADTQRFAPISTEARVGLRRDLLPEWMPQNAFLLGWVGRNPWRKQPWLLYKVIHYCAGAYLVCGHCGKPRTRPQTWPGTGPAAGVPPAQRNDADHG